MKVALTGASGLVGHFILQGLRERGYEVVALGRSPVAGAEHRPFSLAEAAEAPLKDCEALVHAAFSHVPGRYRGGEGDDPEGFLRLNRDGSLALFEAARRAGVSRAVFLSSRAAYGSYPPGTALSEDMEARPETLYGQAKLAVEQGLAALSNGSFMGASLRATGVYGPPVPGRGHKWRDLFAGFEAGERPEPRAGTEVHGADLAQAVILLMEAERRGSGDGLFNLSDILLDRRDLLAAWSEVTGRDGPLPEPADAAAVNAMTTRRIEALGWRPRGMAGLRPTLEAIARG